MSVAVLSVLAINVFVKPSTPSLRLGFEKGKPFGPVSRVDYRSSNQTLLIVLNTDCSYCRESLPLFRNLSNAQPQDSKALHIVALFPNKESQVAQYVKENHFPVETVSEVDLSKLGVSGTPTMILVNDRGEVRDFWLGKLENSEAEEVFRALHLKK